MLEPATVPDDRLARAVRDHGCRPWSRRIASNAWPSDPRERVQGRISHRRRLAPHRRRNVVGTAEQARDGARGAPGRGTGVAEACSGRGDAAARARHVPARRRSGGRGRVDTRVFGGAAADGCSGRPRRCGVVGRRIRGRARATGSAGTGFGVGRLRRRHRIGRGSAPAAGRRAARARTACDASATTSGPVGELVPHAIGKARDGGDGEHPVDLVGLHLDLLAAAAALRVIAPALLLRQVGCRRCSSHASR